MRLFVGGMHKNTTAGDMTDHINSLLGGDLVVEAVVIKDRETGNSKGFGFVTITTDLSATDVKKRLNGSMLDDRDLTVNEAEPKPVRGSKRPDVDGGFRRGQDVRRDGYRARD